MSGDEFDFKENPLVNYSNALIRDLDLIKQIYTSNAMIDKTQKRLLLAVISRTPPDCKECKKELIMELSNYKMSMSWERYNEIFSELHDWLYNAIFKEAFKARPRYKTPTDKKPL